MERNKHVLYLSRFALGSLPKQAPKVYIRLIRWVQKFEIVLPLDIAFLSRTFGQNNTKILIVLKEENPVFSKVSTFSSQFGVILEGKAPVLQLNKYDMRTGTLAGYLYER